MFRRLIVIFIFITFLITFVSNDEETNQDNVPSPEHQPEPSSPSSSNDQPEPGPSWPEAFKVWKWSWPVHVYAFISCYLIVAMVTFAYLVHECVLRRSTSNRLKVGLFTNLFLFSLTRGVLFLVDPYNSQGVALTTPYFITWSIGFPFILSAFSLLLLAMVDTTRIDLTPPRFQNIFTLSLLSVCHLLIVFITDLISMSFKQAKVLLLLCQIYLSVFGLILSLGFLYVARKLTQNTNSVPDNKIRRLQCLVYVSAVVGLVLVCIQAYSASSVFGVLSDDREIHPWPWFILQTCGRSVEIAMCFVIVWAFKRTKYNKNDTTVANQSFVLYKENRDDTCEMKQADQSASR